MEQTVFPAPAVAGVLESRYIEARIYNDGKDQEEVRAWQDDLIQTLATPSFAVIDPESGALIAKHEGPDLDAERFAAWLKSAYERWQGS